MAPPRAKTLALPALLGGEVVDAIYPKIIECAESRGAVRINAAAVERLTTSGAQLLVALLQADRGSQASTRVVDPSPELLAAWRDLGLSHQFPLE